MASFKQDQLKKIYVKIDQFLNEDEEKKKTVKEKLCPIEKLPKLKKIGYKTTPRMDVISRMTEI